MKVTLNEIAEAAGVSRGTVDRVMHSRPHVDPTVRRRVLAVARQMGYPRVPEENALCRIGVLIPQWENPYFTEQTRAGIQRALRRMEPQKVDLVVEEMNSRADEEYIRRCENLLAAGVQGLVLCPPDNLLIRAEIERLHAAGMQIVTYNSALPGADCLCHVGQDIERSGRIAAGLMLRSISGSGRILIVTGNMEFATHRRRVDSFCAYLRERGFPDDRYEIAAAYEQAGLTAEIVADTLHRRSDLRGIYMATESVSGCMEALGTLSPRERDRIRVISNDLTPLNRRLLRTERVEFVIEQDFPNQICRAILILFERLARHRSPRSDTQFVSTTVITPEMV